MLGTIYTIVHRENYSQKPPHYDYLDVRALGGSCYDAQSEFRWLLDDAFSGITTENAKGWTTDAIATNWVTTWEHTHGYSVHYIRAIALLIKFLDFQQP